jgi:cytoskeletal protein CcmA (bactofilin family)
MSFFGNRRQAAPPPPVIEPRALALPTAASATVGFETVLGRNSVLEGSFRCSANVRIDGVFTGSLEVSGNMLIGETARITADINARNISIAGTVNGNVNGRKVQILRTGRIKGDIRATALTTEEGAFIDGKITMIGQEPEPVNENPAEARPSLEVAAPPIEPSDSAAG